MPKRTNDFQRLVYLVQTNLADGATVTESKMLTDRITKHKREVDVCIEGQVGQYAVVVSIECRDHKRIADVSWVDAMKEKHDRLPTNALILASRRGFTTEAQIVAHTYRIQTISLSELEDIDFPTLLSSASSLWAKSVTITASWVGVRVLSTPTLSQETVVVVPDNIVYSSDRNELCHIAAIVAALVRSTYVRDYLTSEGKVENTWFEIGWEHPQDQFGEPFFLKKINPETFREIDLIRICGPCKFRIEEFGVRHGKLGGVHLAWGKTEILGEDAIVVATKGA